MWNGTIGSLMAKASAKARNANIAGVRVGTVVKGSGTPVWAGVGVESSTSRSKLLCPAASAWKCR